jgi:ATP-binding cassette, subfamily C, bacterial PrsD
MRARVLTRISSIAEEALTSQVFRAILSLPLKQKAGNDALRPVRELDQIKTFLSGPGFATLFDLPWLPFYLAICFFLSPLIGQLALGAMFVLGVLNLVAGMKTRDD